jgi:hypothetical protein
MKGSTFARFLPLAFLIFLFPLRLQAQAITTGISSVSLSANVTESLTITVPVGSVAFGALTPGATTAGLPTVAVQTDWVLKPSRTVVRLVGYFDTTNALTDAGPPAANITTSQVFGKVNGGARNSFTQTISGFGVAGSALQLFSETITGANKVATRNDTLDLEIDADAQQPAGTYAGTLRIQATAP